MALTHGLTAPLQPITSVPMTHSDISDYLMGLRVEPGTTPDLAARPTLAHPFDDPKSAIKSNAKAISDLAHRLYGEGARKLLVILQGMDTSGKDGTTSDVFARTPPLNINVAAFKAPTKPELAHDFLWRVHRVVPGAGEITVFNRSHYEDVLVVRVRGFAPPETVERRYAQINDFERLLAESGTTVLKCMLHISPQVQAARLKSRLDVPGKQWKFNPGDLEDRRLWPHFMDAYETALARCSTDHAPWYVIPSDDKRQRGAIVSTLVRRTLEAMNPQYPDDTGHRPEDYPPEAFAIPDPAS